MKKTLLDMTQLYLIPSASIVLPWKLCFRGYRYISKWKWLFADETALALAGVNLIEPPTDTEEWVRDYRLHRLVDLADPFLCLFRSKRWMRKYIHQEGQWPDQEKALLIVTFHWGQGLWSMKHARLNGYPVAGLAREFTLLSCQSRLRYWLALFRTWMTERAGGAAIIETGGEQTGRNSIRAMKYALNNGTSVYGLFDAPPQNKRSSVEVTLLGRQVLLPRGLIRLVQMLHIPVVVVTLSVDKMSGQRKMMISDLVPTESEDLLVDRLVSELEYAIRHDSAAWHNWPGIRAFLASDADS